ncbi:unnamed protein product [Hymenolepis diminuta]|uniref:Death domain-containing protein n=1 Tax=Hymenolepis diminuta TaxID=6216 RepID=A0A0R3SF82_HYMDI|nr:unnamed protein product [Hymenolepis diminuta]
MAARVYREATAVPYLGRFVVYARRHHPEESHVRCVCLTDDTEQKTLECQEGFEVIARSGSGSGDAADDSGLVEFLHNRSVWVETAGNLVPVSGIATSTPLTHEENGASPAADQLRFPVVRAFEENRLNTILRIKDVNSPPVGQLAFMPQQRQPGVDTVNPLCVLDVTLPRMAPSMIQEQNEKGLEESVANFFNGTSQNNDLIDSIARSDLDLKKVADNLGSDWPRVAPFLGLSEQDVSSIRDNEMDSDYKMALTCLTLWQERNGSAATGTALSQALKRADREDVIRQSMQNVSLVQHDPELSYALHSLEVIDGASATTNAASKESPTEKFMHVKSTVAEPVAVAVDDGIAENVITPIEISPQPHPEAESVTDTDREELKAALEVLVQQLEESADDGLSLLPDVPPTDVGDDMGVEEEELVPEIVHPGIKLESAVPAFIQEEIEREATGTTTSSPSHPNEPLDLDDIATAGDDIFSMTYKIEESRPRLVSIVQEQQLEKSAFSTSDADIIIASQTQSAAPAQQQQNEESNRNSTLFWPNQQERSSTVSIEESIVPEVYNERFASVPSQLEDAKKSAYSSNDDFISKPTVQPLCGLNETTWSKPQPPRHFPKQQSSMVMMNANNNDDDNGFIIVPSPHPLCGVNEATWGKPQSSHHSRQSVTAGNFDDCDFIIKPAVHPMCGVKEATWGRSQSPKQSTPDNDIPLIVPKVAETLGGREVTWGKPQEPR